MTIFAYGQTGSGKTFTIMGPDESIDNNLIQNDLTGLIPKSVKHIWKSVQSINSKVFIKVSYCEIYNELINDLLSPGTKSLPIRWNPNQGFFVEGLLLIDCRTPQDVVDVLLEGHKNRKVGSHCLNPDSSRSHSLFTMYIIIEELVSGKPFRKYGKITFVDLAGSERLKESGSTGDQVKETGNINRSLFVLGKVISCLSDTKKSGNQHVPYRDSKLTMLLMDSIGGSSKTLMIACVSPSDEWSDETLSTLNYASKSMNIKNIPTVKVSLLKYR